MILHSSPCCVISPLFLSGRYHPDTFCRCCWRWWSFVSFYFRMISFYDPVRTYGLGNIAGVSTTWDLYSPSQFFPDALAGSLVSHLLGRPGQMAIRSVGSKAWKKCRESQNTTEGGSDWRRWGSRVRGPYNTSKTAQFSDLRWPWDVTAYSGCSTPEIDLVNMLRVWSERGASRGWGWWGEEE